MVEGLNDVETVTLFVEDLAAARRFYESVFGPKLLFEDEVSAVYRLGGLMLNLLAAAEAPELVAPAPIGRPDQGPRLLFTIVVADVYATCAALKRQGVALLNGPIDRPWGRRTAAFRDPAGTAWEVAQVLQRP